MITTGQAIDTKYIDELAPDYMYFGAMQYIKNVKQGHFREHSPILSSISELEEWSKVNIGLFRMYKKEVLEKLPVMQHFFFGHLYRFPEPKNLYNPQPEEPIV